LAKGEPEGARTWLQMWARTDPDNPDLPRWRDRIELATALPRRPEQQP
jgi:hypothetical protein